METEDSNLSGLERMRKNTRAFFIWTGQTMVAGWWLIESLIWCVKWLFKEVS